MRKRLAMCAIITQSLAAVVACSGSGGGGTGGGSATGGGTSGMGGGSGGGGGAANGAAHGVVTVTQSCPSPSACSASARASFTIDDGGFNGGTLCSTSTVGGCSVRICSNDGGGAPVYPPQLSAGDITISGAKGGDIVFPFTSPAIYTTGPLQRQLWDGGETLTFSASGDAVPAFSGKTVVAPHDVIMTAPICPMAKCGTVSRSAPLNVDFTGGDSTDVTVALESTSPRRTVVATCPATTRPVSFSTAVLSMFGGRDAGYQTALVITPQNSTSFTAGMYDVTLSAVGFQFGVFLDLSD